MSTAIADYAIISNLHCAALVSKRGAIDWFCPGRFDAPASFAALLGTHENGHWTIAPEQESQVERRYRTDTLVLETCFSTKTGRVRVTDTMPADGGCHIVRIVEGLSGTVPMAMECVPRLDYGRTPPEVERRPQKSSATTRVVFEWENSHLALCSGGRNATQDFVAGETCATQSFTLAAGERCWFVLSFASADAALPNAPDPFAVVEQSVNWWREWIRHCDYRGRWQETVKRSLITLKAMTYSPTGGMVAALTTSLPEILRGEANYDYRYCWLRDAAFALKVLLNAGYRKEACQWRDWLLKAVRQQDMPLHTLYTVDASSAPEERELDWLAGYADSRPVREGNAASQQYQLDLRGELMEVFHLARSYGLDLNDDIWDLQCQILEYLEERWHKPDRGMWEFREILDHLTHSKVWCWVAFDRCIRDAEKYGLPGPVDRWREVREQIRSDILEHGVHAEGGYFTQRYGADEVDAALLMIPLVGFVPADDPRMRATVAEIEKHLCEEGLVRRYRTGDSANREGLFLPCSFWLADNYWLAGRKQEAEALFERLLGVCNDVGLMAEEYCPQQRCLLGNFPQGLTHLALISSARMIATASVSDASLT